MTETAAVIIVLILAILAYNLYDRWVTLKRGERVSPEREAERAHTLEMARLGYAQVPVPRDHTTEHTEEEGYSDKDESTREDRSWQLAWMPKDTAELAIMAFGEPSDGSELLQAAIQGS